MGHTRSSICSLAHSFTPEHVGKFTISKRPGFVPQCAHVPGPIKFKNTSNSRGYQICIPSNQSPIGPTFGPQRWRNRSVSLRQCVTFPDKCHFASFSSLAMFCFGGTTLFWAQPLERIRERFFERVCPFVFVFFFKIFVHVGDFGVARVN